MGAIVADNLQFDRAEPSPGAAGLTGNIACSVCGSQLTDRYFVANGRIVCDKCRRGGEAEGNRGGAAGRFLHPLAPGGLGATCRSLLLGVVRSRLELYFV